MTLAWSTLLVLSGSHDRFVSAMTRDAGANLGLQPGDGSADDQRRLVERKAEALWSRRRVLLPLSATTGISASLVLFGAAALFLRGRGRSGWGRAAWQLGAAIGLPCLVLETVVGYLHSRDLLAAIADLHDPLSEQLRRMVPDRDRLSVVLAAVQAAYLVGTALYLRSRRVVGWATTGGGSDRSDP